VKPLFAFALVGIGGALGSMLRYAIAILSIERIGPGFPWHTAAINIVGSLLIGIVATYSQSSIGLSPYVSAFAMVGVLGGFTTFSTFSYDTVTLLSDGVPTIALAYACGSVILGVLGVMAGMGLARVALHAT
jgi:fluoride exporter